MPMNARHGHSGPDAVDLLITDGSLVDGSGSDARPGTVASLAGRLLLGDVAWRPAQAARTIDASGMVVAPGFIDLHSHGG
ncbi:MAG: hypothetical protein M3R32_05325, partial [Chloroflexota bacterium]|nr:hypothetical protein [Chloroflexota bacterium]